MRDSSFKSREALMDATLDEFSEINYENASLNRIIKNAGISKGTFYYHFKSKEELYRFLLKKSVDGKWAFINKYTSENAVDYSKMDIFDKFLYQAKAGAMFAKLHPRYNKLANMFTKEKGTPIYESVISEIGGDPVDMLKQMVHKSYKAGEVDTSYTERFITELLVSLFSNYEDIFKDTEDIDKNIKNLDEFVRFMKSGLKSK